MYFFLIIFFLQGMISGIDSPLLRRPSLHQLFSENKRKETRHQATCASNARSNWFRVKQSLLCRHTLFEM